MSTSSKQPFNELNKPTPRSGLVAPVIPLAEPVDGLLTLDALQHPITATLPCWNEALPGDHYQLVWNRVPQGTVKDIANESPGSLLSLDIPMNLLLKEGIFQVAYVATNVRGGIGVTSPSTPIIIDRTPPGGSVLAPLLFPTSTLQGLHTHDLTNMADALVATVPNYFDAKWGDVIRSYWNGQAGPTHTVLAEELSSQIITISFDRSFLEQLNDGEVAVTYTVTDRAGNVSVLSQPAMLNLQIHNLPSDLLPPRVPQADDGLIDNADGRLGVRVEIPGYTHALAGDAITLVWGDVRMPEHLLTEAEVGQEPMFTLALAYASLAQAGDGLRDVYYEVRRNGQLLATSPSLNVQVFLTLPGPQDESPQTLVNEALAAPIIKGKSDNPNREDNLLDAGDYQLNADAVIAWHPDFKPCDQINLFWGTSTTPVVRPINQNDVQAASAVVMCVPQALISAEGVSQSIVVRYTVTHTGNPNTGYSPTQNVKVVSPAQLPGGESGLAAPIFLQADRYNTLEPVGSPNGTSVRVKPYRNMHVGDVLRLSFCGFDAWFDGERVAGSEVQLEQMISEQDTLEGCEFLIPATNLNAVHLGRAEARYSVRNAYGQANSLKADAYIDGRLPTVGCSV